MTYLETDQRAGINTGTFISLTETCPGSFSINNATSILCPLQQMQRYLSNLTLSRRLSSTLVTCCMSNGVLTLCYFCRKTHAKPLRTQSAANGCDTLLKVYCNCGPGDNPAQSEVCGHIGGKGNYPCRKCKVGGSQKDKETDDGFHAFFFVSLFSLSDRFKLVTRTKLTALFKPGESRSAEDTLKEVEKQVKVACLGVAQSVKDLQTDSGIKDTFTQHWIDQLIDRSRILQKSQPNRPIAEIQAELMRWVDEKKSSIFNPFLTMKGQTPIPSTGIILRQLLNLFFSRP